VVFMFFFIIFLSVVVGCVSLLFIKWALESALGAAETTAEELLDWAKEMEAAERSSVLPSPCERFDGA